MRSTTIAEAWAGDRNNFNLIRLLAAWLVVYGHAWAITGSAGGDVVTWLTWTDQSSIDTQSPLCA